MGHLPYFIYYIESFKMENRHWAEQQISLQEVDVGYIQEKRRGGGDEQWQSSETCRITHR